VASFAVSAVGLTVRRLKLTQYGFGVGWRMDKMD